MKTRTQMRARQRDGDVSNQRAQPGSVARRDSRGQLITRIEQMTGKEGKKAGGKSRRAARRRQLINHASSLSASGRER